MEIFDEQRLLFADSSVMKNIEEIKVVGKISVDVGYNLIRHTFSVVDLSEADFTEEYKEEYLCLGFSHSGPVYSNRLCNRHYDYLAMFINDVLTQKIILPPNIKRRHMNRIKENVSIEEVVVTDDCTLFSMKDGDVYNKKGTILIFSNKK
ncbi:MAG: hypothetical protein J6U93_06260 [Alistipes sp.]|nr:hypothetical protein [Alistipes sp.]